MAFPVVEATNESAQTAATSSHVVSMPSGVQAGDLLIVMIALGGSNAATFNALTGWTELVDEGVNYGLYVAYRLADGSEGSTVTFTSSATNRSASIAYRISGASDPGVQAPQISSVATGTSDAPNPNTCTPTGGAKDYLWITFFANGSGEEADDDTWLNNAATNYTNALAKTGGTGGTNVNAILGSSQRTNNAASEDAAWPAGSTDVSRAWRAFTLAVHPAVPTQTSTGEVSLADGTMPAAQTSHKLKARARVQSGSGKLRLSLYEGSTNRIGGVGYLEQALTTTLADYTLAIADADADAITAYTDLRIRFYGYSAGGGSVVYEIDQLWLELPGVAGAQETPTPGGAVAGGFGPTAKVAVPQGGAVAGGVAPTEGGGGTSETPTPGGATAGGFAPGPRVAVPQGGASAQGLAPAPRTGLTIGGAVAAGATPLPRISVTQGGAQAGGFGATVRVAVPQGGAVAGGVAPSDGAAVEETPTPGGAVAGGFSPSVRVSTAQGGATARGTAPSPAAVLTIQGASTGGFGATVRVTLAAGGAVAGGQLDDPLGVKLSPFGPPSPSRNGAAAGTPQEVSYGRPSPSGGIVRGSPSRRDPNA